MYTPDNIEKLKENEVFVFGSNGQGQHLGGAAKLALENFGAILGQAEGLQGQSFAINTMDGIGKIKEGIQQLIECASINKYKIFYVTKLGCGIAGYKEDEIKKLFNKPLPINIILPKGR